MERNNNLISIYWIESHKDSELIKTFLIDAESKEIECPPVHFSKEIKLNYIISIYQYVLKEDNYELNFVVEYVPNKKRKNYKKSLKLKEKREKDEHFFIYDFISLEDITYENQFELFLQFINKRYSHDEQKKRETKEILFVNTRGIILANDKSFDFVLYISIFVESYTYKEFLKTFLLLFGRRFDKKIELTLIGHKRLEQIEETINTISNNQEIVLSSFENKMKLKNSEWIYEIILLFNYYFQREKLIETIKSKYIPKKIDTFLSKLESFILTAEELRELVKLADTIEKLKIFLKLSNDFVDLLITIDYNHKNIRGILTSSPKEKSIELEQYVIPKEQEI